MKSVKRYWIALVTAPDAKVARRLIRLALEARAVACGNLIPKIESHYWWQGKIESGSEVLILFKLTSSALTKLEKIVLENHPYDTPEVIAIPLSAGTPRYLRWIDQSLEFASRHVGAGKLLASKRD